MDQEPSLANAAPSIELTASAPVTAERVMWWPTSSALWHESHNSAGVPAGGAGTTWIMAAGEVGGAGLSQTYALIANVSATPATVTVTLLPENCPVQTQAFVVPANSRFNVVFSEPTHFGLTSCRFGAKLVSNGPAIVVEQAVYSNSPTVQWAAGYNIVATKW